MIKKLLTIALCAITVLTLCFSAFAASEPAAAEDASEEITFVSSPDLEPDGREDAPKGKLPYDKRAVSPKTGDLEPCEAPAPVIEFSCSPAFDPKADKACIKAKLAAKKDCVSPKTSDMTNEVAIVVAIGAVSLACAAMYVSKKEH